VGHKGGDPFPITTPLRYEVAWNLPQVNEVARKVGKERYGSEKAIDPSEYSDLKVDVVIDSEHSERGADLLGTCSRQVPGTISEGMALEAVNTATGMAFTEEFLVGVEEKLVHLERAFDVREGIRRANDEIPKKWLTEKVDTGLYKGEVIDKEKHEKMKDTYYQKRGWDVKTGIPKRETLERVGLGGVADDLENLEIS
jgi:aldehyde:ferredoxin oxidoreductase